MPIVTGEITPSDPLDTYPVVTTQYQKGGCHTEFAAVNDWLSTTNLPNARRQAGMIVSAVTTPRTFWCLGTDLTTWTKVVLPYASAAALVSTNAGLTTDSTLKTVGLVQTLGRGVAGDGGEGQWRWVAGGSATVNAGTVIADTGGQWQRVVGDGPYAMEWWCAADSGVSTQTQMQSAIDISAAAERDLAVGPGTFNFLKLTMADDFKMILSKNTVFSPLTYTTEVVSTTGLPGDQCIGFIELGNRSEVQGNGALIDMRADVTTMMPYYQSVSLQRTANVGYVTLPTTAHGYVVGGYISIPRCSDATFVIGATLVTYVAGAVVGFANVGANMALTANTSALTVRCNPAGTNPCQWYAFRAFNMDKPKVENVRINNCFTGPLYYRTCTYPEAHHIVQTGGYGGPKFYTNLSLTFTDYTSIDGIGNYGFDTYYGTWTVFQSNEHTITNRHRYINMLASDTRYPNGTGAGVSYVCSIVNLFGDWNGTFSEFHVQAVNTQSKRQFACILLDGTISCLLDRVVMEGTNIGYDIPLAIEGTFDCTISNVHIDGKKIYGSYPGVQVPSAAGMHIISGGLHTTDTAGNQWLYAGTQARGRSNATRNKFANITINGHNPGVNLNASNNDFIDCDFSGNTRALVMRPELIFGEDINYAGVPGVTCVNNTFTRCRFTNSVYTNIEINGSTDAWFFDCDISNADQGNLGTQQITGVSKKAATALLAGSTTTVLNWGGAALVVDELVGYSAYISTLGPTYRAYIASNTATTITLLTALPTAPGVGQYCVIDYGPCGDVNFNNCRIGDTNGASGITLSQAFSWDPTQNCSSTTTPFLLTCRRSDVVAFGQKVTLKGACTGNTDLIVQVYEADKIVPDGFWALPLTAGSVFELAPGGAPNAVVAGAGTVGYTDAASSNIYTSRCTINFSTNVGLATDARYYIGVDVAGAGTYEWRRLDSNSDSGQRCWIDKPFSASFAGKTYRLIKADGNLIREAFSPFNFSDTELIVNLRGTSYSAADTAITATRCWNWPLPLLTVNSTTPNVQSYPRARINNTAATLISNFLGGQYDKTVEILVQDGNTTLDFTGASLRGYGADQLLTAGTLVVARYYNGLWYCTIIA